MVGGWHSSYLIISLFFLVQKERSSAESVRGSGTLRKLRKESGCKEEESELTWGRWSFN